MTIESSNSSTNITSNSSANITSSSNSSVLTQSAESTTVTNTPEYLALLQKYTEMQKPQSPAQIRATAEVTRAQAEVKRVGAENRNKMVVLIIVGLLLTLLTVFGCYVFIEKTEIAKDVWVIIGPIITAGISGTVGFLTGEKQANNDSN